ncbi:MAG: response regulator [Planctomycetota bacterium]|jgi:CheY-like chemotaxis protein
MARLIVPAPLESEFAPEGRFGGVEVEKAEDFRQALRLLMEQPDRTLFLGGDREPLDRPALEAAVAAFEHLAQPVLVVSSEGRLLWASEPARREGLSLEAVPSGDAPELFEPRSRHPFLKAITDATSGRILARAVVRRGDNAWEVDVVPCGGESHNLAAAVFNVSTAARALYQRVESLAQIAPDLFPEDVDALVRLPGPERLDLVKKLIEKAVQKVFDYDDFILRTVDARTGKLEAILARSGAGAALAKRSLKVGTEGGSVAGYVAATGKPYLVEDASDEPLWILDLEQIKSAVIVPLKLGNRVIGTFAIEKTQTRAFDYYDLMLASIFAGYVTAALDMADLVNIGQSVLVERVAESVTEEMADHLENIAESVEELRRLNIGDSIAVISRLESIRSSASNIRESIVKGARKVGAAVAPPAAEAEEGLAGKRILVADDEPSILQSLGDILRSSGCEVEFARDGFEAVDMATKKPYDLVISDIKMPRMSGYEVYSSIKSKFPETSVILMTAYGYDPTHSIVRARQEGLEAVLYKPFRAETLRKSLRQALQRKEAEK